MTPTEIQLLVTLKAAIVPLDSICKKYFNLSPAEARRRAALHQLPVPVWRLVDSQKAPLMVRVADLARVIDAIADAATEEHAHAQV